MQTLGLVIFLIAVLGGLAAWGYRQWQRGHLAHVKWLPQPKPTTEPKP